MNEAVVDSRTREPVPGGALAGEWKAGWLLVLVSLLGYAFSTTHTYTVGVFMPSIEAEFGWSRTEVSFGVLLYSIVAAVLSPVAGWLIGRYGLRRVGLPGMLLYCLSLASLSLVAPPVFTWWAIWCLIGATSVMVKPTLWGTAISRQFFSQRGVALAIVLCGSSLCSAAAPSLANYLIEGWGWRFAYLVMASGYLAIIFPLMFLFFRTAPTVGVAAAPAAAEAHGSEGNLWNTLFSYRFLAIALPALLMTTALMGIVVHFVPMLTSIGLSKASATGLTAALGAGSIAGRLITGLFLDRVRSGHVIGSVMFLLPLVPIAMILAGASGTTELFVVALLIGFSFGSEMDITIYLSSRYFGVQSYSTVLGAIMGMLMLGNGIGATLAGKVYDSTGGYSIFLLILVPIILLASGLTRSLGPYPEPVR